MDKLLPLGRLRESPKSIYRADFVVITKCPERIKPLEYRIFDNNLELCHYQLLIQWNQRINLTAIEEEQDVVYKHFLDSALFFKASGKVDHLSLLDVGTGAGFPGVVLKIMAPTLSVCLLDSLNKRVDFLQKLTATLQLEDISAIHGRAEEWGHKATYRQQFDLVTARAVARLSVLNELCLPFVKVGGRFIALKGPELNNELADAERGIADGVSV